MPPDDKNPEVDQERARQAQQLSLWGQLQKASRNLIHTVMMRGGGEPFGAPFEAGTSSLTERTVNQFKQRSFFSFETLERLRRRRERNKFTRHGASPFRGAYQVEVAPLHGRGRVDKFLDYLRTNRFFVFGKGKPGPAPSKKRPRR